MIDRKNLVGGDLSPIDIHSEEFKKKADELWKKTKKQGYLIITNDKEHANMTPEEIDAMYDDELCITHIDCYTKNGKPLC